MVLLWGAVTSGQLVWLPEGSEMPEETNCRFAASQEAQLPGGLFLTPLRSMLQSKLSHQPWIPL